MNVSIAPARVGISIICSIMVRFPQVGWMGSVPYSPHSRKMALLAAAGMFESPSKPAYLKPSCLGSAKIMILLHLPCSFGMAAFGNLR
jgi:hypothetical protein